MHEGIAADGRRLFPAFPYPSFTKVTDSDISAIDAYLHTLAPVCYVPPANDFLLNQRWALRLWNAMFFDQARFVPDKTRSVEWNRGAYLVDGLGHCGACHTPRGPLMAEKSASAYQGGVFPDKVSREQTRDWSAVNLTSSKNGLGAWSVDELTKYLTTGFSQRAGAFGPMNEVIVNSLKKLAAEDVRAMAVYLKSLPAANQAADAAMSPEQTAAGKSIYQQRCEKCHSSSGRGGMFSGPPLVGSAVALADNPESLINVVLYGAEAPSEVSLGKWETMNAFGEVLDDAQIAAVSNYVRGSWGNQAASVSPSQVARQR
jgi:mono/diheme cytochrome c family protein